MESFDIIFLLICLQMDMDLEAKEKQESTSLKKKEELLHRWRLKDKKLLQNLLW